MGDKIGVDSDEREGGEDLERVEGGEIILCETKKKIYFQ